MRELERMRSSPGESSSERRRHDGRWGYSQTVATASYDRRASDQPAGGRPGRGDGSDEGREGAKGCSTAKREVDERCPALLKSTYPFPKLLLSFLRLNPLRSDGETRMGTEQVAKEVFHGSLVDKQLRERSRVTEPRYRSCL